MGHIHMHMRMRRYGEDMSALERRLQLLLDAERYAKVSAEAQRSGRSVAAVIREAIDLRFVGEQDAVRMASAAELLAMTVEPDSDAGESPADLKDAYAAELQHKFER